MIGQVLSASRAAAIRYGCAVVAALSFLAFAAPVTAQPRQLPAVTTGAASPHVVPVQNIARDNFRWQLRSQQRRQYRPPNDRNQFDRWDRRDRPSYRPYNPSYRPYRQNPAPIYRNGRPAIRGLDARQAACARRYRTYDPRTNTYFSRPGVRSVCRL